MLNRRDFIKNSALGVLAMNFFPEKIFAEKNIPDYSKANSWYQIPKITKDVDTFYILATEYMGFSDGDPNYATLDNSEMVEGAKI